MLCHSNWFEHVSFLFLVCFCFIIHIQHALRYKHLLTWGAGFVTTTIYYFGTNMEQKHIPTSSGPYDTWVIIKFEGNAVFVVHGVIVTLAMVSKIIHF